MSQASDARLQEFRHLISGVVPDEQNMTRARAALLAAVAEGATREELVAALREPLEEGPFAGKSPLVAVTEQRSNGGETINFFWINDPADLAAEMMRLGDTAIINEVQTAPGVTTTYQEYLESERADARSRDLALGQQAYGNIRSWHDFTGVINATLFERITENGKDAFNRIHNNFVAASGLTQEELQAQGRMSYAETVDLNGDRSLDIEDAQLALKVLRAHGGVLRANNVDVDRDFGRDGLGDDGLFQLRDLRRLEQVARENGIDLKRGAEERIGRS
jgi:hypothetical protein